MSLAGRMPQIGVMDVLHLLAVAGKTGVVHVAGSSAGIDQSGAVYVRDGRPVAAESDSLRGEEALELICSWEAGSLEFRAGATAQQENLDRPFQQLLERVGAVQREWQEIHGMFPSPHAHVRLVGHLPADVEGIQLGPEEWGAVAAMSAPRTLLELVRQRGGGLPAYRALRNLAEDGLIAVEKQDD